MTKLTHTSISREMPVHVETMKFALLLLMMSVCLIDFVSARGVAMVGKLPGYFLTEPTYGPSEEKWYWTKRYILFIGTGSTILLIDTGFHFLPILFSKGE